MRSVIQNKSGEYLVKKDAWSTTWSRELNDARLFNTKGGVTTALKTMNTAFNSPIDTSDMKVLQVEIVLKPER